MAKVIIVGGGLFGSTIAHTLHRLTKHDVMLIDKPRPGAPSLCAACLTKPSWLSGLHDYEIGLNQLKDTFSSQQYIQFKMYGKKLEPMFWVPRNTVLMRKGFKTVKSNVLSVSPGKVHIQIRGNEYYVAKAKYIIVAAGVWTKELLPDVELKGLVGTALWFEGKIEQPQVKMWAPYKQVVAFNDCNKRIWVGDGSAILEKNWISAKHGKATFDRARKVVKGHKLIKGLEGTRPFTKDKMGILEFRPGNLIVSTGGAKNGIALAGIHAAKILETIK